MNNVQNYVEQTQLADSPLQTETLRQSESAILVCLCQANTEWASSTLITQTPSPPYNGGETENVADSSNLYLLNYYKKS